MPLYEPSIMYLEVLLSTSFSAYLYLSKCPLKEQIVPEAGTVAPHK